MGPERALPGYFAILTMTEWDIPMLVEAMGHDAAEVGDCCPWAYRMNANVRYKLGRTGWAAVCEAVAWAVEATMRHRRDTLLLAKALHIALEHGRCMCPDFRFVQRARFWAEAIGLGLAGGSFVVDRRSCTDDVRPFDRS